MFAYHGADGDSAQSGLLERWESPAARGHRIVHRDHYANPRPVAYLMALVGNAIGHLSPTAAPDLVFDRRFSTDDVVRNLPQVFGRTASADVTHETEWTSGLLAESGRYDHVVLAYADALGLGCEAGERMALHGRDSVLVINGRRRAFRLDRPMARRLRISRFLARTRLVERALALSIRPIASTLAVWDRMARNTP